MALLGLLIGVCSISCTKLVGQSPVYQELAPDVAERFRNVPVSMYTLFAVMTLEGWTDMAEEALNVSVLFVMFIIAFIMTTHFAMLSLVVGVMVDKIQQLSSSKDIAMIQLFADEQQQAVKTLKDIFQKFDADDNCVL